MIRAYRNPECRQGKHHNCAGDAWGDEKDSPTVCECGCHFGAKVIAEDGPELALLGGGERVYKPGEKP